MKRFKVRKDDDHWDGFTVRRDDEVWEAPTGSESERQRKAQRLDDILYEESMARRRKKQGG